MVSWKPKEEGMSNRIEQVSVNQMLLLVSHGVWGLRVEYGFNDKVIAVPLRTILVEQAAGVAVGRVKTWCEKNLKGTEKRNWRKFWRHVTLRRH